MSLSGCGARRPAVLPTILALLACLAAAGCQQRNLAPDTTVLGECQRQAEEDPKVKDLLLQTLNGVNADPTHFEQLKIARRDATNACLRARGVQVPGGVEPVMKPVYIL
jgi:hypothetical protein